jgi:hypothetical protein
MVVILPAPLTGVVEVGAEVLRLPARMHLAIMLNQVRLLAMAVLAF